jgi:hypothetical protein
LDGTAETREADLGLRFSLFSCSMRRFSSLFVTVRTVPSMFSNALYSGDCGFAFIGLHHTAVLEVLHEEVWILL